MTTAAQPRPVAALLTELTALGVTLPDRLAGAAALLEDAANGELTRQATQPKPADILTLDRAALLDLIRTRATVAKAHEDIANTAWHVALQVAEAAAALVRAHADEIIGQLRPRFEAAADAVHAAAKSGLTPDMTPADVLALGNPKAMTAWNGLAPHLHILDTIAAARIAMTDECGVAPSPDPFGPRQYGACFSEDAPLWIRQDGRGESAADRWLRLCSHKPARLLETATTEQAAHQWRAPPTPTVPTDDANGDPKTYPSRGYRRREAFIE